MLEKFIGFTKSIVNTTEFMEKFRKSKKDFIRNRKVSFAMNILLIFSCLKRSIQTGIDQFIIDMDTEFDTYSKQAFSKGRQRILPEAFEELHRLSTEFFYKEADYKTYFGHRILAAGGSKTDLPYNKELEEIYGSQKPANDLIEEQYLTVRRSLRYNSTRHKYEIGTTKRKKVRIVDFCDTLAEILKKAKREQHRQRFRYGELYHRNYYKQVTDKGRTYYEVYTLQNTENIPEDYTEISFACLRPDGAVEYPNTVGLVCRSVRKKVKGLEDFHFHMLRHTYTSNLLSNGAAPKDVQELLGHADVSTTMNVYAHAAREAKRTSARLLDKVVG